LPRRRQLRPVERGFDATLPLPRLLRWRQAGRDARPPHGAREQATKTPTNVKESRPRRYCQERVIDLTLDPLGCHVSESTSGAAAYRAALS
jgi:hypothetical protein